MKSRYKIWLSALQHIIAGLLLLIGYTALKCYISDSEFWAISVAKELFNFQTDEIELYYKIPFYLLLNIPHWTSNDNLQVLILSRVLFALLFGVFVIQLYRLAFLVTQRRWATYVYLSFLFGTTYFISQGFRVRSDMMAAFCFINLLLLYFRFRRINRTETYFYLKIFFWQLIMILSTPKAIYFLAILMVAITADYLWGNSNLKKGIKNIALIVIGTSAIIGGLAFYALSYRAAWHFFLNTYSSFADFAYIEKFCSRNGAFVLALAASLIAGALAFKRERRSNIPISNISIINLMAISAILVLLFHNQRLPFFIASLLPILALPLAFSSQTAFKALRLKKFWIINLIMLLFFFQAIFANINLLQQDNNTKQFSVLREIETYVSQFPKAKYYDVIGLLPKIRQDYAYVSQGEKPWQIDKLRHTLPDIIVYVGRALLLEPSFSQFLIDSYLNVGSDIWVKSINKAQLENRTTISLREIRQIINNNGADSDRLYIYTYRPGNDLLHRPSTFQIYHSPTKKTIIGSSEIIFSNFENLDDYKILDAKNHFFSIYSPYKSSNVSETGELKRLFSFDKEF